MRLDQLRPRRLRIGSLPTGSFAMQSTWSNDTIAAISPTLS